MVARAFTRFKEIQLENYNDKTEFNNAKQELNQRLDSLKQNLDKILHKQYYEGVEYNHWLDTHKPFYWFAEFYEILNDRSGFDIVLGNPPFIEYSKVRSIYTITGYSTIEAGNLYSYIIEKTFYIMHIDSYIGMLKQLSAYCTPRMAAYQKFWFSHTVSPWISFFDDRPGKLFDGLEHIRIAISIAQFGKNVSSVFTTNYNKFYSEFRPYLFNTISYLGSDISLKNSSLLKINYPAEEAIVKKLWKSNLSLSSYLQETKNNNYVYYGYGYGYFGKILNFKSYFKGEKVKSSTGDKFIYIKNSFDRDTIRHKVKLS